MPDPIDPHTLARLQQLATVGEIGASVTHETRNLITAISGFAQLARERATDVSSLQRYISMIEREARRCIEILDRFLALSRMPGGEREAVDLVRVIQHVIAAIRHQAELQHVVIVQEGAELVPTVNGNAGELQQVMLNLAINALHAMPEGGRLVIATATAGDQVEIVFSDSGTGVAPELRERIFDPFFTTKPTGTGLGLALCRQLIVQHGGTLELDAEHRDGARFVVRIPHA